MAWDGRCFAAVPNNSEITCTIHYQSQGHTTLPGRYLKQYDDLEQ
jgi:hypothetical protein